MKKLLTLGLAASLSLAMLTSVSAADVTALKGTPTIDGKIDEIYKQSTGTFKADKSSNIWGVKTIDSVVATAYFLWDDNYLYIATDVKDTTVVNTKVAGGWQADSSEHWIKFPGASKNSKIAMDAFASQGKAYGSDYADFDKVKFATTQSKDGYVTELAIPLGGFKAGDKVPYSLQVNDFIVEAAGNDKGSAWGSQKAGDTVTLSDKAVVIKKEEPKKEAAQTADLGLVSAAVAMAASAAVVLKKKH